MKIKAIVPAWISNPAHVTLHSLLDTEPAEAIPRMLSFSDLDMSEHGWVKAGDATIEVDLVDDINERHIATLEKSVERARERFEYEVEKIQNQISNLRCLPATMPDQELWRDEDTLGI